MTNNKYAIASAVGDASLHELWSAGDRNFDVLLIYFGNDDEYAAKLESQVDMVLRAKGQKLHLLAQLIQEGKIDLTRYDYVWFPDDDIAMDTISINKFFEINSRFRALISQPAVLGYTSYWITKHQPQFFARATSFIEVMAPCFAREALAECLHSFKEEESGWGVDDLWWTLLGKPRKKLLIIDAYPMIHTRPIQAVQRFPNAEKNAEALRKRYGIQRKIEETAYLMYRSYWAPRWVANLITRIFGYK